MDISIELSPKASEQIRSVLGAGIRFTLAVSNPNEKVTVQTPQNVQPYPSS